MEQNYLTLTKDALSELILGEAIKFENNAAFFKENNLMEQCFENINRIVQSFEFYLTFINTIDSKIKKGYLNNNRDYFESDLLMSQTINRILQKTNTQPFTHQASNVAQADIKNVSKLTQKFVEKIHSFPGGIGTNYKVKVDGVADLNLDRYQIIHLALLNFENENKKMKELASSLVLEAV